MIAVDWAQTQVIYIPQSYLTFVSTGLYDLDVNQLRLDLKDLEDDPDGMPWPDTHRHNTTVTIVGTTFDRVFEILPPYSVEFEDGQYSVRLIGTNTNLFDIQSGILVRNQVQVIPNNSAGKTVVTEKLLNQQDIDDLWDEVL